MKATLNNQFDAYLRYCADMKGLRRTTLIGYQDVFDQFQKLMPNVKYADQLTPETFDAFCSRLQSRKRLVGRDRVVQGIKASTIQTYISKLHSFTDWLCIRGHLAQNPIQKNKFAPPDYTDKRALERREIDRILSTITQHSSNRFMLNRDLAIVHVLLFAGLRKSELLALKVSDLDLEKRILTVRGESSKSKFTRQIPMSFSLSLHLENYLAQRGLRNSKNEYLWLSNNDGSALTQHGMKHWVDRWKARSGVRIHLHRFRHTFACMLGRNNSSAVKIQKLLGHVDLRMTQSYLRSMGVEDVRDSVQSLSIESL